MTEPTLDTGITTDIYPMPAFVTIESSNLDRTVDFFVNGLDFVSLFSLPGPDGRPALVHLRRWRYQDILVVPGAPQPGTGWSISMAALAEDLPALAAKASSRTTVDGPRDTPWNTRDVTVTDPDGYRIIFTARRPAGEQDEAFTAAITRMAAEQHAGSRTPGESPAVDRP
ncbi:MAG TPA: VOC family protein [Asanoa sp.]|nr:VOC family protein [Asanoa sp.]